MSTINILQAYFERKKQKEQEKQKKKRKVRVKTCFGCLHSSRFDSEGREVMQRRVYCRAWQGIVYVGSARYCELFEAYTPQKKKRRKRRSEPWA